MRHSVVDQLGTPFEYHVDPETLQEVMHRPEELEAWLTQKLREPEPADEELARQHHMWIGVTARQLRKLDLAERHLTRSLEFAERYSTTARAIFARTRLAHVYQWQGRYELAIAEFERCFADAEHVNLGQYVYFLHQHVGKCHYDFGEFAAARKHFETALRLRKDGDADPGLIASSELAMEAADACLTAQRAAGELDRLVLGAHATARRHHAELGEGLPGGSLLIGLRLLLLAGPVHRDLATAVVRNQLGLGTARAETELAELIADGWLSGQSDHFVVTARGRELLTGLVEMVDEAAWRAWGEPTELLEIIEDLVCCATGSSEGMVFDALSTTLSHGTEFRGVAGQLLDQLEALRQHRADARAVALVTEGLSGPPSACESALATAESVRRRVEAATCRVSSRPYRRLSSSQQAELLRRLHTLQTP